MATKTRRPSAEPQASLLPDDLRRLDAFWRACNYLAVGMIYLQDNPLLREPLRPGTSSSGCWGTGGPAPGCPSSTFI